MTYKLDKWTSLPVSSACTRFISLSVSSELSQFSSRFSFARAVFCSHDWVQDKTRTMLQRGAWALVCVTLLLCALVCGSISNSLAHS